MPNHSQTRPLRWQATAILTLFFTAVAGAAAVGWWYARDSPPHQGPIVLISVDGLDHSVAGDATGVSADATSATPGLDALAADSVVFERAYAHSPLLLPAYASLAAGQLPFEHGVRDEGGFVLAPDARTLAELLRNRGFATGGAVSSMLLHPETGLAQGFSFYFFHDDEAPIDPRAPRAVARPDETVGAAPAAADTLDAAESWARAQEDRRYFLFVQVDGADADAAVERVAAFLRERDSYDRATIVLIGHRGRGGAGAGLDEEALRVPLLVKQPYQEGAGWRIDDPVQHIDLVPTLLDLVRAPIPRHLRGRSLKPLLTDEAGRIAPQPMYAESLAGYVRLGASPVFALAVNELRYVRGASDTLQRLRAVEDTPAAVADGDAADVEDPFAEDAARTDMSPLSATLDRLLASYDIAPAAPVPAADRERLARAGYLQGLARPDPVDPDGAALGPEALRAALEAHEAAARLLGERNHVAAIRALQAIARTHPALAGVQYQIGAIALRTGDVPHALAALRAAGALRPDAPDVATLLAAALLQAGRLDDASVQAAHAVSLASGRDPRARAAAHEVAVRVALARQDAETALAQAAAVQTAMPGVPMQPYVEAVLAQDAGDADAALRHLEDAAAVMLRQDSTIEGLHLRRAALLAQADRPADAEAAYLQELRAFPDSAATYAGLAELYHATGRDTEAEAVLDGLLQRVPTRDAYAAAARTWAALGERARADRVRSEARARFRGLPQPARPARGTAR
jgi:arylsulfatase A-like enzyme/tetratricopeptide (TPR) repeat protein